MKCSMGYCKKRNDALNLDPENAIIPAECECDELRRLFSFFEHRAPNIDSIHSPLLDLSLHDTVLQEMMGGNSDYAFYPHNKSNEEMLSEKELSGNKVCDRCKRFACKRMTNHAKRDPSRMETDLECLLRHLRNSLAHGHVFINRKGNYTSICFEDTNEKKNITARIVVNQAQLKKWMEALKRAVKDQAERGT